jgi:hypothetical protein
MLFAAIACADTAKVDAAAGAGPAPVQAQKAEKAAPVIHAVRVQAPPVIDGKLDDPCWSQASRLEGFFCPNVDSPPPDETIGLICVDEKAIYIGFICNDKTPSDIAANETKRNGDFGRDDLALVGIDPWHQHNDIYVFSVNPRGAQSEQIPGGSATKIEWRGDWSAAAARTPTGWQAEIAIPFSILHYPQGQSTFGLAVARNWAKESIEAVYPNLGQRSFDATNFADLVDIRPPSAVSRPVIMSYVTLDPSDATGAAYKTGVDVQYKLSNGLTALAAANPDFKQIEDTVEPISFSYTERYRPDLRPFFVTGQDGFLPKEHLLYTRRIEKFDTGFKLYGTVGDETVGLLDALSYDNQNAMAAAWRHKFSDNASAKLLLVSNNQLSTSGDPVPGGLAYGIDMNRTWRHPLGSDSLWAVAYLSQPRGEKQGSVYYLGGYHDRGSGHIGYDWQARLASEDFNPPLGYYPDVNNYGASFSLHRWDRVEGGPLEARAWNVGVAHYPYLTGGGVMDATVSPNYTWVWRSGRVLNLGANGGRRHDYNSSDVNAYYGWNDKDLYRRGHVFLLAGQRAGGDYRYTGVEQGFRIKGKLSMKLGAEYSSLVGAVEDSGRSYQAVLTGSYDLTTEKTISTRAICRSGGLSAYAAYRQVVRRGMDAYVILGDPDPERTGFTPRVAVKLIWTI